MGCRRFEEKIEMILGVSCDGELFEKTWEDCQDVRRMLLGYVSVGDFVGDGVGDVVGVVDQSDGLCR